MNRFLKYIPLLLVLLALTSCGTQKVVFSGKPGTEIYCDGKVAEVDNSGSAEVEIYCTGDAEFMLSKDPESGTLIPFALNLDPKRGNDHAQNAGLNMVLVGAGVEIVGALLGGVDLIAMGSVMGAGIVTTIIGGIIISSNSPRFMSEQVIPQDIVFTPLVETADYKTFVPKAQRMKDQPKSGSQRANTTRRSGNSRYKADDDHTKNVIGTYIGNGKLMFEGTVTEKYNDIKVVIEKVSDEANMVTVNVLLDDGNPYFGSKSKYSIIKNDDEYVLIHESVNSTISINQYGELVYLNNDVEDDNGTNILKINADKE